MRGKLALWMCVMRKREEEDGEQSMKLKDSKGDACLRLILMVAGKLAATKLDLSMWVRSHSLFLLVFSPKLEEERMGKGAGQKVIPSAHGFAWFWRFGFDLVLRKVLDISTMLGWAGLLVFYFPAACGFAQAVGK
ncbi:hypothetical protein Pyn_06193 [Prunus yedoensis var. nudiflora]|uniref:Uncharacterized protein n=1 Tax=Prunus yedoensis var. nudiflora TaxID=2094558 RepID=A0A314ZFR8_PRUYE|nr:hypothetical protein Pyn_06193 [Prunus yedoensis var. nudiflora]